MTTEDDFWRQLEDQPDDHNLRLVFADWLQENGDQRADGIRALGMRRFHWVNNYVGTVRVEVYVWRIEWPTYSYRPCLLPDDWFREVDQDKVTSGLWMKFWSIQDAESAVALAFLRLPPKRQAELLMAVGV